MGINHGAEKALEGEELAINSQIQNEKGWSAEKAGVLDWLRQYQPVIVLVLLSLFTAAVVEYRIPSIQSGFMTTFMGLLLVFFAMLKLFDLRGFQQSFGEYDLVTSKWPSYGYYYPVLELLIGLWFIFGNALVIAAILLVLMMSVTAVGVFLALMRKKDVDCACTGSLVKVPLGSFSLIESLSMIVMSIVVLSQSFM